MDSGFTYILEPWDWSRVLGSGLYNDDIEWLENTLSECTSKYKIILMHHPAINYRDEFGVMKDVIARNRENFIDVCLKYDVDLVLAGHTHDSIVFDSDENKIVDLPLTCSEYSTLFVQTDDCKQGINYRNISYVDGDILLERTEDIENTKTRNNNIKYNIELFLIKVFSKYEIISKIFL
jgi:3',5'-cyclic AMP phosphodiesterase CpdA